MPRLVVAGWLLAASVAAQPFEEVAAELGVDFEHFNGMTGRYRLAEVTGSGVAWWDYDGDGDLDLYLVQGAMLDPEVAPGDAVVPYRGSDVPHDRLYRHDLVAAGDGTTSRFVDVTATAGIRATGYGMGATVGDVDGDGWLDLYVTNLGINQLWMNRGDGSFDERAGEAGVEAGGWSTGAVFADFDGDGWPDLFVSRYVEVDLERDIACYAASSRRDFCGPSAHPPTRDLLFRNRGEGRFEDVSVASGVGAVPGPGLGVTAEDFDSDGRLDFLVANDGAANHLWVNRGDGTFREDGLLSGLAVNRRGQAEASMGATLADVDGDGDDDLLLTHLDGETNTYYERTGGYFEDRSTASGLGASSQRDTGFGTAWLDVDLDGDVDLLVANGAVRLPEEGASDEDPFPLGQPDRLWINDGSGRFQELAGPLAQPLRPPGVGRGLAVGDFDHDGDTDVVINDNSGRVRLLRSTAGDGGDRAWIGIVPRRHHEGRSFRIGGSSPTTVRSRVGGSYLSSNDPRVCSRVTAEWSVELEGETPRARWSGLPLDVYVVERAGGGAR